MLNGDTLQQIARGPGLDRFSEQRTARAGDRCLGRCDGGDRRDTGGIWIRQHNTDADSANKGQYTDQVHTRGMLYQDFSPVIFIAFTVVWSVIL